MLYEESLPSIKNGVWRNKPAPRKVTVAPAEPKRMTKRGHAPKKMPLRSKTAGTPHTYFNVKRFHTAPGRLRTTENTRLSLFSRAEVSIDTVLGAVKVESKCGEVTLESEGAVSLSRYSKRVSSKIGSLRARYSSISTKRSSTADHVASRFYRFPKR